MLYAASHGALQSAEPPFSRACQPECTRAMCVLGLRGCCAVRRGARSLPECQRAFDTCAGSERRLGFLFMEGKLKCDGLVPGVKPR